MKSFVGQRGLEAFEQGPKKLRSRGGNPYDMDGAVAAAFSSTAASMVDVKRRSETGHPICGTPASWAASAQRVIASHRMDKAGSFQ